MPSHSPDRPKRANTVGPFPLVGLRRGDAAAGCGEVLDVSGVRTFARWAPPGTEQAARARSELRALARVPDTGIPRPLGVVQTEDRLVALQTIAVGRPLRHSEHRSSSELERITTEAIRILHRAHSLGWVHGDISPGNIVVSDDGTVTIVDWELSVAIDATCTPGTLGYSPPESWIGALKARPERDFYALAVVLWECVEQRPAFDGDRETVLNEQCVFKFPLTHAVPSVLACLFDAAQLRRTVQVDRTALIPHTDDLRVAAAIARDDLPTRAGSVASSWPASFVVSTTPLYPGLHPVDVAQAALAVDGYALRLCSLTGHLDADALDSTTLAHRLRTFVSLLSSSTDGAFVAVVYDSSRQREEATVESLSRLLRSAGDCGRHGGWISVGASASASSPRELVVWQQRAEEIALGRVAGSADAREPSSLWIAALNGGPSHVRPAPQSANDLRVLVSEIELALLTGRPSEAYRSLVRVSTLHASSCLEPAVARRLSKCWSEVGVPDAVTHLLASADGEFDRAHMAKYQLRALASTARIDELRRAIELHRLLPLGVDLDRHRAVVLIHDRDPRRASLLLRRHRIRDVLRDPEAGVPVLITRASALRLTQRTASAGRLLDLAERAAETAGLRRLALLARSNKLILMYDTGSRDAVAESWEAHASSCEEWGLTGDAATALIRVAAHWIESRSAARGLRTLERAEELLRASPRARSRWLQESRVYRTWAYDRLESWPRGLLYRPVDDECEEERLYALLLGWEFRGDLASVQRAASATDWHGVVARSAMLAVRELARRGTTSRAFRLLEAVARSTDAGSPLVTSLQRLAFSCFGLSYTVATPPVQFDAADAEAARLVATAAVVVSSGFLPSPQLSRALVAAHMLLGDDAPVGVRRWEWALATAVAHAAEGEFAECAKLILTADCEFARLCADLRLPSTSGYTLRGMARIAEVRVTTLRLSSASRDPIARFDGEPRYLRSSFIEHVAGRDMETVLRACGEEAVRLTRAERAVVIFDLGDGRGRAHISGRTPAFENDHLQVCQSVLARVEECGGAVLLDDAASDPGLQARPSVKRFQPRSLAVVPIASGGRRVGYVYAETRSRVRGMTELDLKRLSEAGDDFGWALEAAYLRQEYRRLRGEYEQARADLARARGLEALGRSTSEIIHELRNLLTVVVGEADLLAGEPLTEAGRTSVVNIATASKDGCNVISRLQSTVRGLPMDEVESLDLHAVLTEVLLVSRVRIAANNDSGPIRVTLTGTPGHYVRGVASELREVFSNLVTNAIDAMPSGGSLAVSMERNTESSVVSMRDTGIGMTEEVKARALEPFFSTKGSRGNGLGLAIVQGILNKHGGSLSIDSVVGAGSTFRVALPIVAAAVGSTRWLENRSLQTNLDAISPAQQRTAE